MPEEIQTPTPAQPDPVEVETPQPAENPAVAEAKTKELVGATNGRNWLSIILIIVVLLFLGGGIVVGMTIFKNQIPFLATKPTPTPEPIIVPTSTPTLIPGALYDFWIGWKDYTNSKYKVAFKYPKEWILNDDNPGNIKIQNFSSESSSDNWIGGKTDIGIYIETKNIDSSKSLEQLVDEEMAKIGDFSKNKIFNNGLVGYDVSLKDLTNKVAGSTVANQKAEYFLADGLLLKTQVRYGESVEKEALEKYNRFALSFKYLPISDFNDFNKWSSYINNEFNYQIKYPEAWLVKKYNEIIFVNFDGWRQAAEGGGSVQISIIPKITADQFILDRQANARKNYQEADFVVSKKESILLGDSPATKIVGMETIGLGVEDTSILVDHNNLTYLLSFISGDEYLEKIASTFKFTN